MTDWSSKLNDILTINQREILLAADRISKKNTEEFTEKEFEKYSTKQKEFQNTQNLKELENNLKKLKNITGKKKKEQCSVI